MNGIKSNYSNIKETLRILSNKPPEYIKRNILISKGDINILVELALEFKGWQYIFLLFEQSLTKKNKDKKSFIIEMVCEQCHKSTILNMTLSAFREYLTLQTPSLYHSRSRFFYCPPCVIEREEEKIKRITQINIQSEEEKQEKTNQYIKNYLNPECSWKKESSTSDRFYEVKKALSSVYYSTIKEYANILPYSDYLKTPYWKAISSYKRRKAGFKCQLCSSNGEIHIHHNNYSHLGVEIEYLNEDLIALCDDCHQKHHDK